MIAENPCYCYDLEAPSTTQRDGPDELQRHDYAHPHYPTRIRRTPPVLVKAGLTSERGWRQVENDEYAAFVRRILRAYARRVGNGDVEALIPLADLADEIDTAIAEAVKGLRAFGYSWAEIGARLGVTRQAAQQRWGSF